MSNRSTGLSKSKLMSFAQCPKRLFLETYHPELGEVSVLTQTAFDTGHQVGELAIELYGGSEGRFVSNDEGLEVALEQTREYMANEPRVPLFEATFEFDGVLVRVDVLLPVKDGWRIVEVKSSTNVKPPHVMDCAVQAWVFQRLGHSLQGIALAHIDNTFVYAAAGNYEGILREADLTDKIKDCLDEVPDLIEAARLTLQREASPLVDVGAHCSRPYKCEFTNYCWPKDTEHPIQGFRGSKKKLGQWIATGYRDIIEVPEDELLSPTQQRIRRVTEEGQYELLPGAAEFVVNLGYPRYYLDFETVSPAIPIWVGTRPYQTLAVQWSCHIEDQSGTTTHVEFLDLVTQPPMRELAERLIQALGTSGPVLMYTDYERTAIKNLIDLFPELAEPLQDIINRLVDLAPVARVNYYHPDMMGSWSIKSVIPTIDSNLDYALLEGINQGLAASDGYLEAIATATTPARRDELDVQLRTYCSLDTEAMVALVQFFISGQRTDENPASHHPVTIES